jgi:hypothetical protein
MLERRRSRRSLRLVLGLRRCSRWAGVGLAATLVGGCVGAASLAPGTSDQAPTDTPTPTETAASPTPSTDISPSGLPQGLDDRIWHTQLTDGSYAVGTLGNPERVKLAPTDVPFAASATNVATFAIDVDRQQSLIRFVGPGLTISEPVMVPFVVASGAFAGSEFVVAGGLADANSDPGVVAINPDSGSSRYLIDAGRAEAGWEGASRTVVTSPAGNTVVASRCREGKCDAQVLSVVSGNQLSSVNLPGFVRLATDEFIVYGNDPPSSLSAVNFTSGDTRWTLIAQEFQAAYLVGPTTMIQAWLMERNGEFTFEVARVDVADGSSEVIFAAPGNDGLVLWPELSSADVAVLGTGARLQEVGGIGSSAQINMLRLETGQFVKDAFVLTFPK